MHTSDAFSEAMAVPKPNLEVADIFRIYGKQYRDKHCLNSRQIKAMHHIEACRTAILGGHVDVCKHGCGYQRISYNSCRNRHCPKCQSLQSARWLAKRRDKILPTHYFHMVFTVPDELRPIIFQNRRILYNILFRAAAQSLLQFAQEWKPLQAEVGFTAILHTWNQEMLFHPHLHVVVTGGGLDASHSRWIPSRKNFLVPVRALSKKFAGKFLDFLKNAFRKNELRFLHGIQHLHQSDAFQARINQLYRKKWVVYSKRPFGGPEQVFQYLGRYTHRVAISNHRLVEMTDDKVTFLARDNQNPGQKRAVSVHPEEFIRRFLLHILPERFVKTRHYGLLAPGNTKTKLEIAKALIGATHLHLSETDTPGDDFPQQTTETKTWVDILYDITGIDLRICPKCGGELVPHPLTILDEPPSAFKQGPIFFDSS